MKFTVLKPNFVKALQIVNKAINTKSSIPVLANVLMSASKDNLILTTSDLQVTISVKIGAKVSSEGQITVPAKLLNEFINQVTDEEITCELDNSILKISTNKANAKLNGTEAEEFPEIKAESDGITISYPSSELLKAISQVQFVSSFAEGRPILAGVFMKLSTDDKFVLATTDGFRMSEYRLKSSHKSENNGQSWILPAKAFADVIKSFASEAENIDLTINTERSVAIIKIDKMESQIRMIEGDFPDYEAIVPTEFSTTIEFEKEEISNAVKLASIFSRDNDNMVKIIAKDSGMEILSQPSEIGSNSSTIVGNFDGKDIEITFDAKYLLDFINNVNGEQVYFYGDDSHKPAVFRSSDSKENYFYLAMPMKANW